MNWADVKLESGEVKVVYDDTKQTPEKLASAIDKLGFQASLLSLTAAPKPTLYVDGLTNQAGVRKVETSLKRVSGVRGVIVDRKKGEVFVEYDARVKLHDLVAAVEAVGLKARAGAP